jgi:WW domain-binding protein 4
LWTGMLHPQRKREEGAGGKVASKEEAEALARREAARQRVQQRTMAAFGLQ